MNDYSVLAFSDGNGNLYQSNLRSASYKWIAPGRTDICLNEYLRGGGERCIEGRCEQGEKAESVCIAWVMEGQITLDFQPIASIEMRRD